MQSEYTHNKNSIYGLQGHDYNGAKRCEHEYASLFLRNFCAAYGYDGCVRRCRDRNARYNYKSGSYASDKPCESDLSKAFAAFTVGAVFYATVFIVCTFMELIFGSPSAVISNLGATFLSYLLNLVPLFVLTLLAVFINILCSGPTLTMLLCIAVYVILKFCGLYVPTIGNVVFTSFMNWQQLYVGHIIPFHAIISKVGILVGWGVVMFSGSYLLFDKKEF